MPSVTQVIVVAGPPDTLSAMDDDIRRLLDAHETQRTAHLRGDAALMGSTFAQVVDEAYDGEARRLSCSEMEARFADLFSRVRYLEWSDSAPAVAGISGELGWMLVRVHARRVAVADGAPLPDFDASWVSVYERVGGEWKLRAISSSVVEVDRA